MTPKSFTAFIVLAMALGYLQSYASLIEGQWRAQVDLLPIFAAYVSMHGGMPIMPAAFALLGGCWLDLLSANPLGSSMVTLLVSMLCLQRAQKVMLRDHWAGEAMVGALVSALHLMLGAGLVWITRHHPILGWAFFWHLLINTIVCALLSPWLFALFKAMDRLFAARAIPSLGYRGIVEVKRSRTYRNEWQ
ncbi:MAG: rod shape-determining protein MreD [Verrucomicrobiota bacterium]|jgi:cell shape-determining protein MreD